MSIEQFLTIMLIIHIAGGTIALLSGLAAMFTAKGGKTHRLAGKIYFGGMTAVFVGAVIVALGHNKLFLLMVGVFSYYMTVRGYRILFLKQLGKLKPGILDLFILITSGIFMTGLLTWGVLSLVKGISMGIVAITFGGIGLSFLIRDIKNFITPPKEKMHWWFTHIGSMGGSYISAVTAFVVVNIQFQQFNWVLWILPPMIGSIIIGKTIKKYRVQFATR